MSRRKETHAPMGHVSRASEFVAAVQPISGGRAPGTAPTTSAQGVKRLSGV